MPKHSQHIGLIVEAAGIHGERADCRHSSPRGAVTEFLQGRASEGNADEAGSFLNCAPLAFCILLSYM